MPWFGTSNTNSIHNKISVLVICLVLGCGVVAVSSTASAQEGHGPGSASWTRLANRPPGGSVINISSKASLHPSPFTVVYAAAKAGLNALTKAAAQELGGRGIRVNAIVCGTFHTDSFHQSAPTEEVQTTMASNVALGRIAAPEEIVGTALYLASDASSYLSGELIVLDGG